MMNPLRLSTVPAPVLRSVIVAAGIVGLLATGSEGLQTPGASPPAETSAPSDTIAQERTDTPQPGAMADSHPGGPPHDQPKPDQAHVVAMAEPSLASAGSGVSINLNLPEPAVATAPAQPQPAEQVPPVEQAPHVEKAPSTEQAPPADSAPVQIASVNPAAVDLSDIQPAAPAKAVTSKAVTSVEIMDECFVVEICVDRYLWALYERTRKEDTIKQVEWRDVTVTREVKIKGKGKGKAKTKTVTTTVSKPFTKLVDQDFGWKDPKAADRAGMPMADYVIGGMDRSFKLKLFHLLHAAEAAGLSPGITSGFRDDYRQSIASGLKAASNRSYHGGSLRGGYGHGLAADIVSVQGDTRNQRFASSSRLWTWVDANGKAFGIARPYLGRDPPHVAPTDGQEYAKHNRGTQVAAAAAKKVDSRKTDAKTADAKTADAKQADVKKADAKTANTKNVSVKQARATIKKIEVKKPNLVIMRDASSAAKRLAAHDGSRLSKRTTVRDTPRAAKRVTSRPSSRVANAR